jgi:hypothetical protein
MENKFLQLLNDAGGKVEKGTFENLCRESGLFNEISVELALSREQRRLMALNLLQKRIVVGGQKFKSVMEIKGESGATEYLMVTAANFHEMLEKYPGEIVEAVKSDETDASNRAIVQQNKVWESQAQLDFLLPLTGETEVRCQDGDSPPENEFVKLLPEYEAEIKHHSDDEYIRPGQYEGDFVWPRYNMVIEMDSYEYHCRTKTLYNDTANRDFYYLERGYNLEQVHARWLMQYGPRPVAQMVVDKIRNNYKPVEKWQGLSEVVSR